MTDAIEEQAKKLAGLPFYNQRRKAIAAALRAQPVPVQHEDCAGHVGSPGNPKICARCGVDIDSLRPPEEKP